MLLVGERLLMNNLTWAVVLGDAVLVGELIQLSGTLDDQMFHNGPG